MGEVLGVGCTHFPPLLGKPENFTGVVRMLLGNPIVSEKMRDVKNWPPGAQHEWEHQVEAAHAHKARLIEGFRQVRRTIDEFNPDVVVLWGDDQYEQFKEDIVPPFHVFCQEGWPDAQPLLRYPDNPWGEDVEKRFHWKGNHQLAKHIVTELIEHDFPISYSYKPTNFEHGLGHAFANTLMYLDFDRNDRDGFPYPVVPISVNSYGRQLLMAGGGMGHLNPKNAGVDLEPLFAPPGPTPRSCFRLGQLVRQIVEEIPERVALIASTSWSHSFLTKKSEYLFPDRETDAHHLEQLRVGEHYRWADLTNEETEAAGGHEWKNWICLAGAMEDRTPTIVDYMDSWVFNSNKCFCYFKP